MKLSAIIFGGSDTTPEEERKREAAVAGIGKYPIYRALKDDPVIGGCMLSAGELDSSKEYLQQGDGSWVLVYQVFNSHFLGLLTGWLAHRCCFAVGKLLCPQASRNIIFIFISVAASSRRIFIEADRPLGTALS